MNKTLISPDSRQGKEDFIEGVKKIIADMKSENFDRMAMFRGARSKLSEISLRKYLTDEEVIYEMFRMVQASEELPKSRHQIDYLIFVVLQEFASAIVPGNEHRNQSPKEIYESVRKSLVGKVTPNKALTFVILSKEGVELRLYDVVDALDKEGTIVDRVISPNPIVRQSDSHDEHGNPEQNLIVIAGKQVVNVFDEDLRNLFAKDFTKEESLAAINEFKESFEYDDSIFPEESEFIKQRNLKQNNTQDEK